MPDPTPHRPLPNRELVIALYASHHTRLVRDVARKAATDRDTADDACQYAWSELSVYPHPVARPLGWLLLVAVRRAQRIHHQHRAGLGRLPHPGIASPELVADAHQALEALAALSNAQREAVALVVGGFGYDEIAAMLGTTRHAVKLRVARGYRRLRAMRVEA